MYCATTTRCAAVRCAVMQWERLTGRERVASVIAGQRPSVMYDGMRMLCRPTYSAARPAGRERCGRGAGAVTACGDQECCGPVGWAVLYIAATARGGGRARRCALCGIPKSIPCHRLAGSAILQAGAAARQAPNSGGAARPRITKLFWKKSPQATVHRERTRAGAVASRRVAAAQPGAGSQTGSAGLREHEQRRSSSG